MCSMLKKKRLLASLLCSISLILLPFGQLNLGCYAEEVIEPSTEEDQKNWQYWNSGYSLVKDNTQGFLTRRFGFITDNSAGASIYSDAMETLNDAWDALSEDEKARYDNDFRYYVGYQILGNRKGESVTPTEIDVQPEAETAFQTAINVYVEQNPLGYHPCYIYSYNFLSPSAFPTYQMYSSVKEYMKQGTGRYSVAMFNYNSTIIYVSQYLTQSMNLGFIGTQTSGIFTSVKPYVNWSDIGNSSYTPTKQFNTSGTSENTNVNWSAWNLKNISSPGQNVKVIFSPNEKNEMVYVFDTLNAYKNYNSGTPQAYYQADPSLIDNHGTFSSIQNSNNSYSYVTNNVQSGWTAQEVYDLVNLVMTKNSGSGSGSSDNDNPFGFLGRIGDLIHDLVVGVGDLLTDLVGSLVDVVLGTEDENGVRQGGIVGLITDIISSLTGLINTNIGSFLSAVFSWLPSEFVTLFKAMLLFGIFFSIWKMIRG